MQEQERRRFFRIEDEIGLVVTPIPAEAETQVIAVFEDDDSHASIATELRALRDSYLPQRRSLEYKSPTVAAYLRAIEKQIDLLALAVGESNGFSTRPDTAVNLSAQGLSFQDQETYPIGSLLEVKLTLFPDLCRIKVLGRVVRSGGDDGQGQSAVEFAHIRDADREAIVRHVHLLQRLKLQAETEAKLDEPK